MVLERRLERDLAEPLGGDRSLQNPIIARFAPLRLMQLDRLLHLRDAIPAGRPRGFPSPDQFRGDEDLDPIEHPGVDKATVGLTAPLDQQMLDARPARSSSNSFRGILFSSGGSPVSCAPADRSADAGSPSSCSC